MMRFILFQDRRLATFLQIDKNLCARVVVKSLLVFKMYCNVLDLRTNTEEFFVQNQEL